MNVVDRNGTQIVCTSTKAEYEASHEDAEPVHFVQSEGFRWGGED